MIQPDWHPFHVASGKRGDPTRAISTPGGVGDRLRAAAFAELQAREAFRWAASHFTDVPESAKSVWIGLAHAEDRHLKWLMTRMAELRIEPGARSVSDQLWISFCSCKTAQEFAYFMASAEERGRKAGERFYQFLRDSDPITAEIFRKIAEEEVEHIASARKYFGYPASKSNPAH